MLQIDDDLYIYAFVRKDLAPIIQLVQACHAVGESSRSYPAPKGIIPNLVVLGVDNEQKLIKTKNKLDQLGIKTEIFLEPDIDKQYTALCTEPVSGLTRRVFRNYKLLKV